MQNNKALTWLIRIVIILIILLISFALWYFVFNKKESPSNASNTNSTSTAYSTNQNNASSNTSNQTSSGATNNQVNSTLDPSQNNGGSNNTKSVCITEKTTKICKLKSGINETKVSLSIKGYDYVCYDKTSKTFATLNTDNTKPLIINPNLYSYCVSDSGDVEVSDDLSLNKNFNTIYLDNGVYKVPKIFDRCIWTSEGGSGAVPYIYAASSDAGPEDNMYNVRAFCIDDSNAVNLYTFPK